MQIQRIIEIVESLFVIVLSLKNEVEKRRVRKSKEINQKRTRETKEFMLILFFK